MTVTETAPAEAPAATAPDVAVEHLDADADLITEELLVEEISIDGMCGVY